MDDIINYIKAINGHLFGGYVRDKFAGAGYGRDIDCRINKEQLPHLINILFVGNFVHENIVGLNYRKMDVASYTLLPKSNPDLRIKVDILCCSEPKWTNYACDFDVNMLAESNDSIFIRPHFYSSLWNIPNKINHVIERCKMNKFALIALPKDDFQEKYVLLLRSKDLVERGWIMDDFYLHQNSWVFSKWSRIQSHPCEVRLSSADMPCSSMCSQTSCSLCHENFKPDDMVFNSCCNHNFHWECAVQTPSATTHTSTSTGISHWFKLKQSFQCPMCRQTAVKCISLISIPRLLV